MLSFTITGPHCQSCTELIKDIMDDLDVHVEKLELDAANKTASLTVKAGDAQAIITAIKDEAGYEAREA